MYKYIKLYSKLGLFFEHNIQITEFNPSRFLDCILYAIAMIHSKCFFFCLINKRYINYTFADNKKYHI